jgi:hypothetical protein
MQLRGGGVTGPAHDVLCSLRVGTIGGLGVQMSTQVR